MMNLHILFTPYSGKLLADSSSNTPNGHIHPSASFLLVTSFQGYFDFSRPSLVAHALPSTPTEAESTTKVQLSHRADDRGAGDCI